MEYSNVCERIIALCSLNIGGEEIGQFISEVLIKLVVLSNFANLYWKANDIERFWSGRAKVGLINARNPSYLKECSQKSSIVLKRNNRLILGFVDLLWKWNFMVSSYAWTGY